jgi:hypothetical protein
MCYLEDDPGRRSARPGCSAVMRRGALQLMLLSCRSFFKGYAVALTPEQRAELEALGPENVREKLSLSRPGRGAAVAGFKTGHFSAGDLTRGDIEDWLAEKHVEDAAIRNSILRWAKIAGWAAIISALIGTATLWFTIWPRH